MAATSSTDTQGHILVVDDATENLELLYRILVRRGFRVETANSGNRALEMVQVDQPELILMDVCMPDLDGYSVCEILKSDSSTKDIPVIFVSALDEVVDKVKAFEVGGVDYIGKPYHAAEVVVRVSNHLALRRLHQQLEVQNERLRQEICDRLAAEAALQAANKELERLAHMDGLTQVANRRSFDSCLEQEWRRMARERHPLTLMLCDVDFFKRYNDTYGHQAGDDCLQTIAKVISTVLKRPSDFIARYGGEEFAIILPNTATEGASHVAAEMQAVVKAQKIVHSASSISQFVTLSIGISTVVPSVEFSSQALLAAADRALYKAKLGGRNRICFEDVNFQMEDRLMQIAESETSL